jgi:SAM-dependent methyltransferase
MGIRELRQIVGQLVVSAEALGAIGAALQLRASGREAAPEVQEALQAAIAAIGGADLLADVTPAEAVWLVALSRAMLTQSLDGIAHADGAPGWGVTDPQVLDDWGTISASLVPLLQQSVVPRLAGLAARLEAPTATFLDVGVGTAQLSIAMCQTWPTLSVIGLDPWAPALAQARRNLARAGLAERVSLEARGVEELAIDAACDLAWLATPFIPPSVLETGVARIARALRPGGWLLLGQFAAPGALGAALVALRTARSGGRVLSAAEAEGLLTGAGLRSAQTLPPETWPAGMLVVAQRPPD